MGQASVITPETSALLKPVAGRVVVYFPVVGSTGNSIASLECLLWQKDNSSGRRFMLSHPKFSADVERILADVRFNEAPGNSDACVRVRFAPSDFSGRSYGLALAIADKLARFAPSSPAAQSIIYATGNIVTDGHGTVGTVEDFAEKLMLIEANAQPGSLFIFPKANYDQADSELRKRLQHLREQNVEWRYISRINELKDLFAESASSLHGRKMFSARAAYGLAAGVLGLLLGAYWYYSNSYHNTNTPAFDVNYFYRPEGRGPQKVLQPDSNLHSGDYYSLSFTPSADNTIANYVYILQIDAGESVYCLFPRRDFNGVALAHENPVYAGQIYHVPDEGKAFKLDQSIGKESMYFLTFQEHNKTLAAYCQAPIQEAKEQRIQLATLLAEPSIKEAFEKSLSLTFNHVD